MTERQAVKAAKKRGLVTKEQAEAVALPRHRRTCPACGETFLPLTADHRGFCCACCAYDWGEARYAGTLDRRVARGVEVVLVEDGAVGVVESAPDAEHAVVAMEDGRRLTVGPPEVERIQYLMVAHRGDCPRLAGRRWAARVNGAAISEAEAKEEK